MANCTGTYARIRVSAHQRPLSTTRPSPRVQSRLHRGHVLHLTASLVTGVNQTPGTPCRQRYRMFAPLLQVSLDVHFVNPTPVFFSLDNTGNWRHAHLMSRLLVPPPCKDTDYARTGCSPDKLGPGRTNTFRVDRPCPFHASCLRLSLSPDLTRYGPRAAVQSPGCGPHAV